MAVSDPIRPESRSVIEQLHQHGLHTWMLSGDNEITARAVAKSVGIPEMNVIAGILPVQKVMLVRHNESSSLIRFSVGGKDSSVEAEWT